MEGPTDESLATESRAINQSLSFLESCVVGITQGLPHVPFRQSRLTYLLRDALSGRAHCLLLACVWCEQSHLSETIATLRLAQRVSRLPTGARPVATIDPAQRIARLEATITELRRELQLHDALAGRRVTYDEYTPEEQEATARQLLAFLEGEEEDMEIDSVRHMRELTR